MNPQTIDPQQLFQQAMQAYQAGQFPAAENYLQQILTQDPNQDGILTALGGVLMASGRIPESVEVLEKAVRLNVNNVDAKLNLGIAYQNQGRMQEALVQIQRAAEQAPERSDVQYNWANFLLQTQRFPEAIQVLEKVVQLQPDFAQAHQTLAAVYLHCQQNTEAITTYERALKAVPNDLNTALLFGNLLADIGQTERAEQVYLRAVELQPNYFLPHAVLGKFYLDIGQDEIGEKTLEKAYSLNPEDLNTNILLGNVNKNLGRVDEAEKFYRKALEINPGDVGATQNLRRILSVKIPFWHFEMLADVNRNDAYQKAIEKAVSTGTSVLDIGTGSGLLSMMAARAGATPIYACEMHERLAEAAKEITKINGYGEVIQVFNKKSTSLKIGEEIPEKVDLVISEILDAGALGEGALPSIRHAVQNLAKPDARLIPAKVHLFGQLIEIPFRSMVAPIREISGFDLSHFEQFRIPGEYTKINLKAEKYTVLSSVTPLMEVDFYNLPPAYPDDQPRQVPLQVKITESGTAQAMVFWFDLYLDEEIMVSSRRDGELEHWGQALFCFPNPVAVESGQTLPVTLFQSDAKIWFGY